MIEPSFTVGLLQMACVGNKQANLDKAAGLVHEAAARGAQVVCLQELFSSEYFCQREDSKYFDLAEPIPGPITNQFSDVAAQLEVVLVVPVFERRAPGVYHNAVVVIDADGQLLGHYRKTHIPDDPLYQEKFYFTPGDLGYPVFNTRFARISPLICWDQWFPEAARLSSLGGAELLVYPSAIGWHPAERFTKGKSQHDAWLTMQRSHAIANGVFVATTNRVGHEGPEGAGLDFWGQSFVCDPAGQILIRGSVDDEEVLLAKCHRGLIEQQRREWPFLRDRRIDSYGDLARRIRDEPDDIVSKSRTPE
ncbi:MAG: acyltransferase [Acidobacteria bacterium]|nr:acyltransferase [Acidobacteriota bacterium]|tara:strand:- start:13226 stop:14146 length:921 start_codon:yes stop_codon:yes gene_type:complete